MKQLARFAVAGTLSLCVTLLVEIVVLFQQANLFTLESTIVMALTMRLAMFAGLDPLNLALPGFRFIRAGSIDHAHGSALHWIVSITAGLVFSVFLGTSLISSWASPGTSYNLNNALTVFITTPITAVVFVVLTLLFYWLLKRY